MCTCCFDVSKWEQDDKCCCTGIKNEAARRFYSTILVGLCYLSELVTLCFRSIISKHEVGQFALAYCNVSVAQCGIVQAAMNACFFALMMLFVNSCDKSMRHELTKGLSGIIIIATFVMLFTLNLIHGMGMYLDTENHRCAGYLTQMFIDFFGYLTLRFGWANMRGAKADSRPSLIFWTGFGFHCLFFAAILFRVAAGHLGDSHTQTSFDSIMGNMTAVVEELLVVELFHAIWAAKPGTHERIHEEEEMALQNPH